MCWPTSTPESMVISISTLEPMATSRSSASRVYLPGRAEDAEKSLQGPMEGRLQNDAHGSQFTVRSS